ncbi:MAG: 8-oxo-dGTP diphosphatase [Candidatus Buchananbacteria bacterium]
MGMKKRGFGEGRWNGFGGKVQEGETIEEGAEREVREECGLIVRNLQKFGQLDFEFHNNRGVILEVHMYKSETFEGELQESDEMRPQWFNITKIPFADMWPDDIYWFPLFLAGKKFNGRFLFGDDDIVLEQKLTETESFDSGGSLNDL